MCVSKIELCPDVGPGWHYWTESGLKTLVKNVRTGTGQRGALWLDLEREDASGQTLDWRERPGQALVIQRVVDRNWTYKHCWTKSGHWRAVSSAWPPNSVAVMVSDIICRS